MGKQGNGDGHYGKALSIARPSAGLLAERVVPKGCSRFPLHTLGLRLAYSNIIVQYALSGCGSGLGASGLAVRLEMKWILISRVRSLKSPSPSLQYPLATSSPLHSQKQRARKQNQVELISKIMAAAKGAVSRAFAMFFLLLLLICGGASGMWEVDCRWQQGRKQPARLDGRSKKTVTEHINLLTDASCVPLARLDWAHRGEWELASVATLVLPLSMSPCFRSASSPIKLQEQPQLRTHGQTMNE